jgi:Na+/melibiose symporter-like transporter
MPVSMALFPVIVFIPKFYTTDMAVPMALAATIMLAVRISDVFTDPFFDNIFTDGYQKPFQDLFVVKLRYRFGS